MPIGRPMQTFEQGDIVRVPFPYTDRDTRQRRPALVVSIGTIGEGDVLLWVVMITSAENRAWPGDVPIPDHTETGLSTPSVVRPTKIATVETRNVLPLGRVTDATRKTVMDEIHSLTSTGVER
jgi:mRNA interferase MazF